MDSISPVAWRFGGILANRGIAPGRGRPHRRCGAKAPWWKPPGQMSAGLISLRNEYVHSRLPCTKRAPTEPT
jgi:hypothetical protein